MYHVDLVPKERVTNLVRVWRGLNHAAYLYYIGIAGRLVLVSISILRRTYATRVLEAQTVAFRV